MRAKFPAEAISYHFGITVTSPIEGCHATLKTYLQRGHGDLRGVFLKMKLFWKAQQQSIETTIAKQQLRPRHSINIPLFAAVVSVFSRLVEIVS